MESTQPKASDQSRAQRVESRLARKKDFAVTNFLKQGASFLEASSLNWATVKDSARRCQDIMEFAKLKRMKCNAVDLADALLVAYVNSGCDVGIGRSEAQRAFASFLTSSANFSRGQLKLPRMMRALRGWAKLEPGVALPPIAGGLAAA